MEDLTVGAFEVETTPSSASSGDGEKKYKVLGFSGTQKQVVWFTVGVVGGTLLVIAVILGVVLYKHKQSLARGDGEFGAPAPTSSF